MAEKLLKTTTGVPMSVIEGAGRPAKAKKQGIIFEKDGDTWVKISDLKPHPKNEMISHWDQMLSQSCLFFNIIFENAQKNIKNYVFHWFWEGDLDENDEKNVWGVAKTEMTKNQ